MGSTVLALSDWVATWKCHHCTPHVVRKCVVYTTHLCVLTVCSPHLNISLLLRGAKDCFSSVLQETGPHVSPAVENKPEYCVPSF